MVVYKTYVKMIFNRGTLWEDSDDVPYSEIEHKYVARAKWECQQAKNEGYDAYVIGYGYDDDGYIIDDFFVRGF